MMSGEASADSVLPVLRQDLELLEAGSDWTGAPTWLIHDPLRNRYFRIGAKAVAMLGKWRPIAIDRFVKHLNAEPDYAFVQDEVEQFVGFLMANSLILSKEDDGWRGLHQQAVQGQKTFWKKAVHNYLFFRIPLFRPQKLLDFVWPFIAPLFTKTFAIVLAVMGIASLYLVSRQWDVFKATFFDFLSIEGFLIYGASLIFIKAIHELGHAFIAKKHGVDVPVIGIAFIVLMPILYTDTTGAHRLRSKAQRLHIDLAGIYCELALAVIATVFWVFLPDGPLRSAAFSTATLSWVLSLTVNLNPFMRFDGYYVLSDLIGFENLQERGFALAKWRLREFLFGLGKMPPEILPATLRRGIILHAWATWIYRFFLFLGIALLVYHFFIKIIGILLFVIEICWFILLPIARELLVWWQHRKDIIMQKRSRVTLLISGVVLALFVIPWSSKVTIPALVRTDGMITIHAPQSAKISANLMRDGMRVNAGDILVELRSPDLVDQINQNSVSSNVLHARLNRLTADRKDQSLRLVLEQELMAKANEKEGLQRLEKRLIIRAAASGILVNVDSELHDGMWINSSYKLAYLLPDANLAAIGLVPENDIARISAGAGGKFVPDDLSRDSMSFSVERIGEASVYNLPDRFFADAFGGRISVHTSNSKEEENLAPRGTWYPVHFEPEQSSVKDHSQDKTVMRGVMHIDGERVSFASRIVNRVAGILLRESGF